MNTNTFTPFKITEGNKMKIIYSSADNNIYRFQNREWPKTTKNVQAAPILTYSVAHKFAPEKFSMHYIFYTGSMFWIITGLVHWGDLVVSLTADDSWKFGSDS